MKIRRLLIANRGEIARRVIRTAHRMGIETVAVHSDADAQALHVKEATVAHSLGGSASAETYLCAGKLLAAARATGADAVHPGYGFLSENADFAQAVADAGLVWVGPPAAAIRALGSKSSVKRIAKDLGVPCLPGYAGEDQSLGRFEAEARRIGFPLMVKAAAGGGGRGMRLVADAAQLAAAIASARSEAEAAFGSGELLLERALLAPRHVEVQVFADSHGHCIHLGERDCSVQRRHQKLVEESPSPAVDPELRERMGGCAVRLATAAGYVGAGTVEFLVEGGEFFLMEMNTRLQVEHPVTECVTGLDLVEWQLRVAHGEALLLSQDEVAFNGHAVEVRLCAEDDAFHPQTGRVLRFRDPGGVRFDHAIFEGLEVTPYYDSMLGKLVAHAPSREEAVERLASELDRLCVLGVATNRRLLAACLRHPSFRAGDALVPFLARQGDAIREALASEEAPLVAAVMPSLIRHREWTPGEAPGDSPLKSHSGGLPMPYTRPLRARHRGEVLDVPVRDGEAHASFEMATVAPRRHHAQVGAIDLFIDDISFEPRTGFGPASAADEIRAPFNGKVIAVRAQPGGRVARGDALVILESMKLEHALVAPREGVVRAVHVTPGQQAATSQLIVTLEAAA